MEFEKQARFLASYEDYVRSTLVPTSRKIRELFRDWRAPTHWADPAGRTRMPSPSPIQRAFPRIKRPESVVDKIFRRATDFPDGLTIKSVRKMHDAVAARIVVYFMSNLALIDHELRESELIEISEEYPPIAYLSEELATRYGLGNLKNGRKDSGYASIHYIVRFRNTATNGGEGIWFEIQVRTLAEDLWGEIEHILGYKPEKQTSFAVRKQFQILSAQLTAIDEHFNLLFEELTRFQEEAKYPDNNALNAENLPAVLSELGIGCAQKEIDGLLKLLASRGFRTVGDLRIEGTIRRLEIIRNTYRSVQERDPENFEIVAGIAAIRGAKTENDIASAVKEQIAFLLAWTKLQKEFPE